MKIHFVGIGGIGISGLAKFLLKKGHEISGSDIKSTYITKELESMGMQITIPHSKDAITTQDIVIYSAAIKSNNEEIVEAKTKGVKTLSRKEALPMVLGDKKVYAIGGAHGKSTTTAMLSSIMSECSAIIGAESKEFGSNVRYRDCECIVFEADESDSSFLNSNPYCAIVTNAEPEHMEYYKHNLDSFHGAYREFLEISKHRVINAEDDFLASLDIKATKLYPSKDIKNLEYILKNDEPYTRFELKNLGFFDVWGFGEHIALDASLAILAAMHSHSIEDIREGILRYRGIKKRFDILHNKESTVLIDDYAHHPTEISVTLDSIKEYARLKNIDSIITIWQPHKYSRTLDNLDRFKTCFKGSNRLVILPVYSAGEDFEDIDFKENFEKYNPIIADRVVRDEGRILILRGEEVVDSLDKGLIVGFGAGDITYQLRGVN